MNIIKLGLDRILYWVTVVLFALLVIIVVWQVASRQIFDNPATWTEEGARLTFVWLGLFASAFLFGERGHIAVEYVARKLSEPGQRRLAITVQTLVLSFALVVLVWGGIRAAGNAWLQDLSALPFTLGQMYLALPVSGALMAFYSVFYLHGLVTRTVEVYADHSDEEELPRGIDLNLDAPEADNGTGTHAKED